MRIAIDANRYVDYCNGVKDIVQILRQADEIHLPFVVVGELRAGFTLGAHGRRNEQTLSRFLQSPRASILFADENTTHLYASLMAQLRRAGTPIPTNDVWIAALVVQHDLALLTRDRHFEHIPQIHRL